MSRMGREAPLPAEMQGRWIGAEEPGAELIISGPEIICFGQMVEYDWKEVAEQEGVLTVTLHIDESSREDSFQRANITGLALAPDGALHAYNVKFGCEFVRPTD